MKQPTFIPKMTFEELTVPMLHAFVPVEQQLSDPGIQALGYDKHQILEPQWFGGLSLVVVADDQDAEEVFACADDASQRLGFPRAEIYPINNRRLVENPNDPDYTYFDAIWEAYQSDVQLREKIASIIALGGFFNAYEAPEGGKTAIFAKSLGFPDAQILHRISPMERLTFEIEPDKLVVLPDEIPRDMILTRELVHSVQEARELIWDYRDPRHARYHPGALNVELEARAGGNRSALLEEGAETNEKVEELFRLIEGREKAPGEESIQGENIVLDRIFKGQIPWSMGFVSGQCGFRTAGFHTKAYGLVGGSNLKLGSVMTHGPVLPGVSTAHIAIAIDCNAMIARGLFEHRGYVGDMSIVWRSIPGFDHPMVHRINGRADSEEVADGVLIAVERQLGLYGQLLAMHTRLYQDKCQGDKSPWQWRNVVKQLSTEMYTRDRGVGAVVPVPYWDAGRECMTMLLIQVGKSYQAMLDQLHRIQGLIGALTPDVWEQLYSK